MKVLYDYQAFELQKFGGISRYFCELFQRFAGSESVAWELPIRYSENQYLAMLPRYAGNVMPVPDSYRDFLEGLDFKGKWRLYNLRNRLFPWTDGASYNQRLSAGALQKGDFAVFHPTYYDDYFLRYLGKRPFVLTVHDLIHEKYPAYYAHSALNVRITRCKRTLVERAAAIIAVSENTKKDVIDFYGVDEKKIVTIYHGAPEAVQSFPAVSPRPALPNRYLLYVGGRSLYKNFNFFIQAVQPLLEREKDLCIVCTGEAFSAEESKLFGALRIAGRIIHCPADEATLAQLYRHALAFVFPSLYEGFGLPVLEAFSLGCPAVLSRSSSLPEVGGEAAVYFDPHDAAAMREAVAGVIAGHRLRAELIEKGYRQLRQFSWQSTAAQTLKVYESLA